MNLEELRQAYSSSKSYFPEYITALEAECERLREELDQIRTIVSPMFDCGCGDGSFIYGCRHSVRKLKKIMDRIELSKAEEGK